MKMNVYSVYDKKVQAYTQPWFSPTHGAAIRAFSDHANDKATAANKHPEDFQLFHIGSYDDQTGLLEPCKLNPLGIASEYIERDPIPLNRSAK